MESNLGKIAALVLAWYLRTPWTDPELAERARDLLKSSNVHPNAISTLRALLEQLGEKP
jgi:hypothetical protein